MKINRFLGIFLVLAMVFGASNMAVGAELFFKDYNAAVVQEFEVPLNIPAPDYAGPRIAEKVVYQLRRYSQKFGLFEIVVKEGVKEIPAGKKTLLIKGEVKEYTRPSVGRRIRRSFIPGGEYTSTAAFAAHYKFIDRDSGEVIYETDLRTGAHYREDTVDYAMERNAEAAAKLVYRYKIGK
ncbi:MAG: hypothetical protein JRI46_00615 [Deltaproteobacteria bacterium]|nr:hypothetical protein [Deltaproteobacteria bacterium]